jgi:hypothetical protein
MVEVFAPFPVVGTMCRLIQTFIYSASAPLHYADIVQ